MAVDSAALRPLVGEKYDPVRGSSDHPCCVRVYSVGSNHVRFMHERKVRRNEAGRMYKMRLDEFSFRFRKVG